MSAPMVVNHDDSPTGGRREMHAASGCARSTSPTRTASCWSSPPMRHLPPEDIATPARAGARDRRVGMPRLRPGSPRRGHLREHRARPTTCCSASAIRWPARHRTGTPGNWWTVFALVPDVFEHAVAGFAVYPATGRKLDPGCGTGPDPGRLGARQPVRLFAALQGLRGVWASAKSRSPPSRTGRWPTATARWNARYWPTPTPGAPGRPGCRRRLRRAQEASQRRRNPRIHLHRRHVRHARDHVQALRLEYDDVATPSSRSPRPRATATVIFRTTSPERADSAAWGRQACLPALSNIVPVPEPAAVRVRS